INKKPGNRLFSFILPLLVSYLIFWRGFIFLQDIIAKKHEMASSKNELEKVNYLSANHLNLLQDQVVYIGGKDNNRFRDMIVYNKHEEEGENKTALSFYPVGQYDPVEREITLADIKGRIKVTPENPLLAPMFFTPDFLTDLFSDIDVMTKDLKDLRLKSYYDFQMVTFVLVLFCSSCRLFSRITRWPLLNAVLSLAVFRLFFFGYKVLTSDIAKEIYRFIPGNINRRYLPSLFLFLFSMIFILWDILFTGRKTKQRKPIHD
ncbi:MAG: hypothetical protein AB1798_11885, partial [Spirochaetota bacterium]